MFFYYQMCQGLTRFATCAAESSKPFRNMPRHPCSRSPNAAWRSAVGCPPRPRRGGCLPDTRAGETLRACGPCFSLNLNRISNTLSSASIHLRALVRLGGGIGRRKGLKIPWDIVPCRFDSGPRHHDFRRLAILAFLLFFWERANCAQIVPAERIEVCGML